MPSRFRGVALKSGQLSFCEKGMFPLTPGSRCACSGAPSEVRAAFRHRLPRLTSGWVRRSRGTDALMPPIVRRWQAIVLPERRDHVVPTPRTRPTNPRGRNSPRDRFRGRVVRSRLESNSRRPGSGSDVEFLDDPVVSADQHSASDDSHFGAVERSQYYSPLDSWSPSDCLADSRVQRHLYVHAHADARSDGLLNTFDAVHRRGPLSERLRRWRPCEHELRPRRCDHLLSDRLLA